jgi:hypothetical protein
VVKGMSIINEELAKRNHDNYSMSDYKSGSATSEYNQYIQDATEKIEAAKSRVSDEGKEKLDNLLNWYKSALASWINKHNANGAGHVSSFISGPANYNMRKHEKWLNKEGNLWKEYDNINDIEAKIGSIIHGDKIIRSDDKNALDKLRNKLEEALKEHEGYKEYNKQARKEGKETLRPYVLTNSNQRIKNIKDRIKHLEKLEELKVAEKEEGPKEIIINDIKIIDSLEANRVQIFFNFKPDSDIRTILKSNGYRWTPSIGAWQHYRGYGVIEKAKEIVSNIK